MERGPEFSEPEAPSVSKKKRSNKKNNVDKNQQRRFSDEQIRLLESMFESETKLEPRKKVQLARELGLQPRQVAIWFQNRRARWKSKQIEQDFTTLRAQYEILANQFESLKQEKQSLISQLEKLNDLLGSSTSGNITNSTTEVKNSLLLEGLEKDREAMQMQTRDDNCAANDIVGDLKHEGITGSYDQLQNTSQEGDLDHASLASLESWYRSSFDVFDQPRGCTSQWLNFWS